jgi:hypothetical protein
MFVALKSYKRSVHVPAGFAPYGNPEAFGLPLYCCEHFSVPRSSSREAFPDDDCSGREFIEQSEEFCPRRNLHGIHPASKTPYAPVEHAIRAFEYDEAEASRMHVESEHPLLTALIGHAVGAFWFATTGRSRSSSQRNCETGFAKKYRSLLDSFVLVREEFDKIYGHYHASIWQPRSWTVLAIKAAVEDLSRNKPVEEDQDNADYLACYRCDFRL